MALPLDRPPHPIRPKLDAQPVDQASDVACPARLFDQAFLCRTQSFGPLRLERESIETELRIERGCLVGEQAVEMLRFAARNRCGDTSDSGAAVDSETDQRQPPRAEMPLLQLPDEIGDQSLERLGRGLGVGRRFLEP